MKTPHWKEQIKEYDERRDIIIPGDKEATIAFCLCHFLETAKKAIEEHGAFAVALSGGSTPKAIFEGLLRPENQDQIDWKRVLLFWSDERCVLLDSPESNYRMAMDAGFGKLPLLQENIFPMYTIDDHEEAAQKYDTLISEKVANQQFDLVMLGMGEDGHTASLFPNTHALAAKNRLATSNYIPEKNSWRLTLTFDCINAARNISVYVLGKNKAEMAARVLSDPYQPDDLPAQKVGTPKNKALWIFDNDAATKLL